MVTTASTASVRPSLNLTPRSLPVDAAANTPSSSSSIFGSGKAREEPPAAEVRGLRDGWLCSMGHLYHMLALCAGQIRPLCGGG